MLSTFLFDLQFQDIEWSASKRSIRIRSYFAILLTLAIPTCASKRG